MKTKKKQLSKKSKMHKNTYLPKWKVEMIKKLEIMSIKNKKKEEENVKTRT